MRQNRTKRLIANGRVAFGAWCTLREPAIVEIIGHAGFDFCIIDMEHGPVDGEMVEHMCRAADAVGITSIIRMSDSNPKRILLALEAGAQGILVPHVKSGTEARAIARCMRYPPAGNRGMTRASRAAHYSMMDFDTHMQDSNAELLLIALIEDREAVDDIEAIVTTPGLDVVFIGPADLSGSYGHPSEPNHPAIVAAVEKIMEVSRRAGGARFGLPTGHSMYPKSARELVDLGAVFITHGLDSVLLAQALKRNAEALAPFRTGAIARE
jgi:4-hydroxy-2-oxoheptanedioate aldolase